MTRETTAAKSRRLLVEQRLTVIRVAGDVADAVVQGDTGEYLVGHDPDRGWHCSCPARRNCSHVIGLMLVTIRRRADTEDLPGQPARASAAATEETPA
jgi:hypothetical protein